MCSLIQSLLFSLLLTLALELIFALLWGVRRKGLLLVVLMNILTNPIVVMVYNLNQMYQLWLSLPVILLLEAGAIAVEGLCCRGMIRRPWLFAILINLFSYGTGELLKLIL